jgi:hypothetical protein
MITVAPFAPFCEVLADAANTTAHQLGTAAEPCRLLPR